MRPVDLRRLRLAITRGKRLLHALPKDDGILTWTIETEQLLLDLFSKTPLWFHFVQDYRGTIVGRSPDWINNEGTKRNLRHRVEALVAALATVQRRDKDGPVPRDPLLEASRLALEIPLTGVDDYISGARTAYGQQNWEQVVSQIAKAYERAVYAMADLVAGARASKDFQTAIGLIANKGIITEETKKALSVRDVSLWGWVCLKGRHAEGAGAGKPADEWVEARYALDWAGSAIAFLGESYVQWIDKQRDV